MIPRRTDRIIENRIGKSFCDAARAVSKGEACIERRLGNGKCWIAEEYGLICPELETETVNSRS